MIQALVLEDDALVIDWAWWWEGSMDKELEWLVVGRLGILEGCQTWADSEKLLWVRKIVNVVCHHQHH